MYYVNSKIVQNKVIYKMMSMKTPFPLFINIEKVTLLKFLSEPVK